MKLNEEQEKLTKLLQDKSIKTIHRHRSEEVVIEFNDGSCFIVDIDGKKLEFSITGPKET